MILPQVLGGLRVRLILLMALALLPLGLIALALSFRVVEEISELNRERLQDIILAAAADQTTKIERAVGAGFGLGAVARTADLATCQRVMERFLERNPSFSFAGFIPVNGLMECSSAGTEPVDFSAFDSFETAVARAETFVEFNSNGAVTNRPVLIVNVPVFQGEALFGFASISLPLEILRSNTENDSDLVLTGVATTGQVFDLSSDATKHDLSLPRDLTVSEITDRAGETFRAVDQKGQVRLYSAASMSRNSYVVLGSWPVAGPLNNSALWQASMPLIFACSMWIAGMVVAYFGLSRMVLAHLKDLRSAMRRFALGERSAAVLQLKDAPGEFKDAERAFNRMVLLITEAEARQLTDLHEKEVLLREVHHRVKNNLQMIASIMNLQARSARSNETRQILDGLQRRVRGLAMLHRSLYTQAETSQVDTRELADAVVTDSTAAVGGKTFNLETDLASVAIYPDQAVPLSMWIAEAMTNAIKYVGKNSKGESRIWITLAHDDHGMINLTLGNTVAADYGTVTDDSNVDSTGLGAKLMTAFCRQLEGTANVVQEDGAHILTLRFKVQGFDPDSDPLDTDRHDKAA